MPTAITIDPRVAEWVDPDGDGQQWRKDLPPGAAAWLHDKEGDPSVLVYVCACGCGALVHVPVKPSHPNGWDWNDSQTKPTTRPSIWRTIGCRWHGWLTDGVLLSC